MFFDSMRKFSIFVLLLLTLLCGSAFAAGAKDVPFSIPEDLGEIESVNPSENSSAPWVILIRDAHCVIEAQKNIGKILGFLQQRHGLNHVYLEGGEGRLDVSRLSRFLDQDMKNSVMEKYLGKGEISGAEYAALMSNAPAEYYGIENKKLYDLNRKLLLEAEKSRQRRDLILFSLRKRAETKLKSDIPLDAEWLNYRNTLRQIDLLIKASRLDLEREDFENFTELFRDLKKNGPAAFEVLGISYLSEEWTDISILFAPVMRFYRLVLERDKAMGLNVIKRLSEDKPGIAVLVTGGFHCEGISRIFAESGISTVIVTPKFSDWAGRENYVSVHQKAFYSNQPGSEAESPQFSI